MSRKHRKSEHSETRVPIQAKHFVAINLVDAHGTKSQRESFLRLVDQFIDNVAARHPSVATCNEILKSFEHTRSIEARLVFFVGRRASLGGRAPIEFAMSRKRADWTRAKLLARGALE